MPEKGLDLAQDMAQGGEKNAATIKSAVSQLILSHPFTAIDYVSICDPETLVDVATLEKPCLMAMAVRVGNTRLIDNTMLRKN